MDLHSFLRPVLKLLGNCFRAIHKILSQRSQNSRPEQEDFSLLNLIHC